MILNKDVVLICFEELFFSYYNKINYCGVLFLIFWFVFKCNSSLFF